MSAPFDRLHPAVQHHVVNTLGWASLRPLQEEAIGPVLDGSHALLLAPTAGGKTEAAVLPVLSRMLSEDWGGLGVLYLCPIKALLNNLELRLRHYTELVGRRCGLWHSDVGVSARRRLLRDPPDVLLTTPESLEAMMISSRVDAGALFSDARCVVVDEIHAFAGDDRGWHLLSVIERVEKLAGRRLQRLGLSATVGNPEALLSWLTVGDGGVVVSPPSDSAATPEVSLDYVGNLANAATVISRLHRGEKRLVFCDSRARTEELGAALRDAGVQTYLSHSSLSLDQRRGAEAAFAQARDCVIVATSTLELGIDVGDLDRVIQIDSPATVASFLQRLGRTGRRSGTTRNCLFLATSEEAFLQASGLLRLWAQGWVEPIEPPPLPLHVLAHQVLALALQEGRVGANLIQDWLGRLPYWVEAGPGVVGEIIGHMVDRGLLQDDHGLLSIGREGEATFGWRHFMDLTSVFTSEPLFTVMHGRSDLGRVHETTFLRGRGKDRPVILTLGGRHWKVNHIDWARRIAYVEAAEERGRTRWPGEARPLHAQLCASMRAVLDGDDPDVDLTARGHERLAAARDEFRWLRRGDRPTTVARVTGDDARWWTFAGLRANATLAPALGRLVSDTMVCDNFWIALDPDVDGSALETWRHRTAETEVPQPPVQPAAIEGLKFNECLPTGLAERMLATRLADPDAVASALAVPIEVVRGTG